MPLSELDLLDPRTFRLGPPHHVFARLRNEHPVWLHPRPDRPPFWVLTRHEDVVRVSRDSGPFSSAANGAVLGQENGTPSNPASTTLLHLDPPDHGPLRAIVEKGFTPEAVGRLEQRIRALCTMTLDRVCERGECDFVQDVAAEFALLPLAEVLGFPDAADRRRVQRLTERLTDPLERTDPGTVMRATLDLFAFANELVRSRGGVTDDGLLRPAAGGPGDDGRLSARQFELFFLLLVTAGAMTTQQFLSGAMLAFFENPEQWRRLAADPAVLGTGVDELARWVSPVMQFQRTATRDTEIAGQPIGVGDRVALYHVSANRDEAVFSDPDRLNLSRAPNDHLGFGAGGPHHCLGESLGRLQVRVLFEELAQRMPDIEPAGPVDRLCSTFLNGIRTMPVRFSPTPRQRRRR